MPTDTARLFLSYGRADATDLAERLESELLSRGYEPWRDRSSLRGGTAWAEQIVAALEASRAMVAILSPHSVRTTVAGSGDDSVCLDEISLARFRARIPIIPVMSVSPPCTVPFEIFRVHYIDFSRWKESRESFDAAFRLLLECVERRLRGEPAVRTWVDQLEPQDFGDYLAERRAAFTGRKWLLSEIDDWMRSPTSRAMLLTAPPGYGKTAVIAELVHRNLDDAVLACHCCRADYPETLRPGAFVRSMAAMIAARIPVYGEMLAQTSLGDDLRENAVERDPERAFEKGLLEVLRRIPAPPGGAKMLLIDGLDEALGRRGRQRNQPDGPTILTLLRNRLDRLPNWLRVLATARHERAVVDALTGVKVRRLDPRDLKNASDVELFLQSRLASPGLASAAGPGSDPARLSSELARSAAGNFLYATLALKALEDGRASAADLESLPPDLPGIYGWYFERRFPDDGTWERTRALFDVLTAARDDLTPGVIAAALRGTAEREIAELFESAAPFLRTTSTEPTAYTLYHRSLGDWLADPRRAGATYTASPATGHRILADGLWALYNYDPESLPEYGFRHLSWHLENCTRGHEPAVRQEATERLARFALDPAVHLHLEEDPAGAYDNLALALRAAVDGPPVRSGPLALKVAAGLNRFRRERLDPRRLFMMAEKGDLDRFERELDLFEAENPWREATKLIAAWLARPAAPECATRLLAQAREISPLRRRVGEVFENRPPVPAFPPREVDERAVDAMFAQLGGMDLEGRSGRRLAKPAAQPVPGSESGPEVARFYAEDHAPWLVSWARRNPEEGTRRLKEYIRLQAANGYRTYRNESLWRMVPAVLEHPDETWVLDILRDLASGALTGGGWEFVEAAADVLCALRAADSSLATEFQGRIDRARAQAATLRSHSGQGDAWGEHRQRFAVLAECLTLVGGDSTVSLELLKTALNLPEGFAGFQASASLALADALRVCGGDRKDIDAALLGARSAAHNIQDATFCARTTARCNAMIDEWWSGRRLTGEAGALRETVQRFLKDRRSAEFTALHYAGCGFVGRRSDSRSAALPAWLLKAATLESLALAFQRPLEEFQRVNPGLKQGVGLADGTPVRVPDDHLGAWLAARFSAEALAVRGLPREERVRLILRLVPSALCSVTLLNKVLARLLLALRPRGTSVLDAVERDLAEGFPPVQTAAGLES